ncbi:MAG: hypothetical protein ACRECA_09990 [Pseudolabrys sp.]
MCVACEMNFWNMIDALPPEDRERILREQIVRFECEAPPNEAPPSQVIPNEREP